MPGKHSPRGPQDHEKPATKRHMNPSTAPAAPGGISVLPGLQPLDTTASTADTPAKASSIWQPPWISSGRRPTLQTDKQSKAEVQKRHSKMSVSVMSCFVHGRDM